MNQPQMTIAICTYNRYALLKELLATLVNQSLSSSQYTILIVDNSDQEENRINFSKEMESKEGIEVIYSFPPGLSRARNKAIECCRTEYIVFIDDDAYPAQEWLSALLHAFKQSKASVIAGPIEPIWPTPRPEWVPTKYEGCLTILDHGPSDRSLSQYEFAYGTNMAFNVSALKAVGGFNVGLGRIGSKTLISDEEIETQLAMRAKGCTIFYASDARVYHRVHENRISRNYFRSRMAWQAVSTLMHDSPLWWREQSVQEIKRASAELGVSKLVEQLFATKNADIFSTQIDLIYHLLLVILNSHLETNNLTFDLPPSIQKEPPTNKPSLTDEKQLASQQARFIAPDTKHLFVESMFGGHLFLFDVYAEVAHAQLVKFKINLWDQYEPELDLLERSISSQLQTLTFLTLEPFIYGPRWPQFKKFIQRVNVSLFGIVHRLPWTAEQAVFLKEASEKIKIIVLTEDMQEHLHNKMHIQRVVHLPLHPTHERYMHQSDNRTRLQIGVRPEQVVFSVCGEAREGKGIELLLEALKYIRPEDRQHMFFLFAGKAKEIDAQMVQHQLDKAECTGYVDLRQSINPLDFAVLTEREFGQYLHMTDIGVLLYQHEQRHCMSGVLPNYIWGGQPVITTADSMIGRMVHKYNLGLVLTTEKPREVAKGLTTLLHEHRQGLTKQYVNESLRKKINAGVVVQQLEAILNQSELVNVASSVEEGAQRIAFEAYLSDLPLLHTWDGGQTWNTGGFETYHLKPLIDFLQKNLPSSPSILETGAGNSTIALLFLSPIELISIAPDKVLFEKIRQYCTTHHIETHALTTYVAGSEWVLPELVTRYQHTPRFDFVLIDGCHNWPMVFIDFFYCNYLLKPGGYIMIDDVQLHSVKELARLLSSQPGFELVLNIGKSLVFRRTAKENVLPEWDGCEYIKKKTDRYADAFSL